MRGVNRAWRAAEKVLADHAVARKPVNVERLAKKYAKIIKQSLDDDISGALIPLDDNRWAILVNSDHHPNRQRFTLAHELGHLVLHGYRTPHADRRFRLRDARSSEGSVLEEIQANQFAAELLMPRAMVMKAVDQSDFMHGWGEGEEEDEDFQELVNDLARGFKVSRQAMAIRMSSLFA